MEYLPPEEQSATMTRTLLARLVVRPRCDLFDIS